MTIFSITAYSKMLSAQRKGRYDGIKRAGMSSFLAQVALNRFRRRHCKHFWVQPPQWRMVSPGIRQVFTEWSTGPGGPAVHGKPAKNVGRALRDDAFLARVLGVRKVL